MDKNQHICCNVKSCVHHNAQDTCELKTIHITNDDEVKTAHYCGNYEE